VIIMFRDCQQSIAGNVSPPQDVFQKGNYVLAPFGAAEREEQHGIVFEVGIGQGIRS